MKKKILACAVALCLVLAVIPAFAADGNVTDAQGFKEALEAGGEVVLGGSFEIDSRLGITITQPVTLDLNGYTVTETYGANNNFVIAIKEGGSLTINDSAGDGAIIAEHEDYGYGIQLYSGATLIVNGGTIETTQEAIDIRTSASNVKIEINGGKVVSTEDGALSVRGSSNVAVDIKGGEMVSGGRTGMYVSGDNEDSIIINMTGGSLTQTADGGLSGAIQANKGAIINISGTASITSNSSYGVQVQENVVLNVSGGSIASVDSRRDAISVEGQGEVNVTGGEISSTTNSAIGASENAVVNVSGGKLTGKEGLDAIAKEDEAVVAVTGGSFSSDVSEYVPEDMTVDTDDQGNFVVYVEVTFSDNDEATDNDKVVKVAVGDKIDASEAPAFTMDGYTLNGWMKSDGTAWDMENDAVSEKITLVPVWDLNAPEVTLTADKTTVTEGESITLTAQAVHGAAGATFTYAWYKDGVLIEGQTGATLTVTESGSYSVKVSAIDGSLTSAQIESEAVTCTVNPADEEPGEEPGEDNPGLEDPDNGGDAGVLLLAAVLAAAVAGLAGVAFYFKKRKA